MKRKVIKRFSVLGIVLGILFFTRYAYAMSEDEIKNILSTNPDFFVQNDFVMDALHTVEWVFLSLIREVCDQAEQLYLWTYHYLTFTTGEEIESFISSLGLVYKGLLLMSITAIAVMIMFLGNKIPNILKSIALSVGIITCTFFVMSNLNEALYDPNTGDGLIKWVLGDTNSITNEVIRTNMYDLLYIDAQLENGLADFDPDDLGDYHYPEISDTDIKNIKINAVINYENPSLSENGKQLLSKYIEASADRQYVLGDVDNGFGWNTGDDEDFGNEFYYRYKINFADCMFVFIAYIIIYYCVSVSVVKTMVSVTIARIIAVLYSADLAGMKKTLAIITTIKDGYIFLFISALQIRLFSLMQAFTNEQLEGHPFLNGLALFILSIAILAGPGVIEKATGYNPGGAGGLGTMYMVTQAARFSAGVAKHGVSGLGRAYEHVKQPWRVVGDPSSPGGNSGGPGISNGGQGFPPPPGATNSDHSGSSRPGTSGDGGRKPGTADKKDADGMERLGGNGGFYGGPTASGTPEENDQVKDNRGVDDRVKDNSGVDDRVPGDGTKGTKASDQDSIDGTKEGIGTGTGTGQEWDPSIGQSGSKGNKEDQPLKHVQGPDLKDMEQERRNGNLEHMRQMEQETSGDNAYRSILENTKGVPSQMDDDDLFRSLDDSGSTGSMGSGTENTMSNGPQNINTGIEHQVPIDIESPAASKPGQMPKGTKKTKQDSLMPKNIEE